MTEDFLYNISIRYLDSFEVLGSHNARLQAVAVMSLRNIICKEGTWDEQAVPHREVHLSMALFPVCQRLCSGT